MDKRLLNHIPVRAMAAAGGSGGDFALARFNSDGSVDTTWASSGKKIQDLGSAGESVSGLAIDSNGKIVVGGTVGTGNSADWGVARLNSDGTLDTTFDTVGYVVTAFTATADALHSIALQSDGKIVAVGTTGAAVIGKFGMARYTTGGALDTTFDTDGKVQSTTNFDGHYDVAIQSDGKIIGAGFGVQKFIFDRFTTSGAVDTTFGTNGRTEVTVTSGTTTQAYALALESNGKIVGVGYSNGDVAAVRLETNGALDASFDGDGKLTLNFGGTDYANDVAIMSDGSLVIAGYTSGGSNDVILARVHASGALSELLYAVHDANFNVTAVNDRDGAVVERYVYDPYGTRTVLDANWAADADGLSDVSWLYGHQGGRHDLGAGLVHARYRDVKASLGRWTRQDPMGYVDGLSSYAYLMQSPVCMNDPFGLWSVSELDLKNCVIILRFKIQFFFTGNWTEARKNAFRHSFLHAVNSTFSTGHGVSLKPGGPTHTTRAGCVLKDEPCPCPNGFRPQIEVVEGWLGNDFDINVAANPTGAFVRSSANLGGPAANLDEGDVTARPSGQVPAVHEFGHLLGIDHPGQYVTPAMVPNSPADYTANGGQTQLMGNGVSMIPVYFDKWANHLNDEFQGCNYA